MSPNLDDSLIIAIDYYDGEAEGFARIEETFSYFKRIEFDLVSDSNEYAAVDIDRSLFEMIEGLLGMGRSSKRVLIYSGSSEKLNRLLDEVIPDLQRKASVMGRISSGDSYLSSLKGA